MSSANICEDPQCGVSFVCTIDYNRHVQPFAFPGVPGKDKKRKKPKHKRSLKDSDATDVLCSACEQLNLQPSASDDKVSQLTEDTRKQIGDTKSCPFCRLVRCCRGRDGAFFQWKAKRGFYFNKDSARIVFLDDDLVISPHQSGRVAESQADWQLLKRWLRLCEDVHGVECAPLEAKTLMPKSDSRSRTFRVIDVEEMRIVEGEFGCRYLALSYSWGLVPSPCLTSVNKAQLMEIHGLEPLVEDFPKTIRDAIDAVTRLGERYIWIDRLCLIQDDREDVLDGMQIMDSIYEGAIVCIVAAAGHDANGGLPGVQPGSRNEPTIVEEVHPGVKMTVVDPLYEVLNPTHYMTRGWTFQELMLSPRCLIFLESRIYYRCCRVIWSEDTLYHESPSEKHDNTGMSHYLPYLRGNTDQTQDVYQHAILRYNTRNLTDQNDALNAMTGMIKRMAFNVNSTSFEGMLVSYFDLCLLFWHPPSPATERRPGFPSWSWVGWKGGAPRWPMGFSGQDARRWLTSETHIFWYQRCPQNNELKFIINPADYVKRYDQSNAESKHSLQTEAQPSGEHSGAEEDRIGRIAECKAEKQGESSQKSTEVPGQLNLPTLPTLKISPVHVGRKYAALQFWTWTVMIPHIKESTGTRYCGIMDTDDQVQGGAYLDDGEYCLDTGKPHEAVILSKAESCPLLQPSWKGSPPADRPFFWVLIIEWQGEVAERKGVGYIYQSHIDRLLPPGRVWKEIVLV